MKILQKIVEITLFLCLPIVGFSQLSVVDTIDVKGLDFVAWGADVNPVTNRLYISNAGWITEVDCETGAILDSIWGPSIGGLHSLVMDTVRNRLYVTSLGDSCVYVFDCEDNLLIASIPVEYWPYGIAVNEITNKIYVVHGTIMNNVLIISGSTNSVIDTITVPGMPLAVAVNPVTNRIYTAGSDRLSVIDGQGDSLIVSFSVYDAAMLGVNSATNRVYVPAQSRDKVYVLDGVTNALIDTIEAGDYPIAAGVNKKTNRIYVSNYYVDSVNVIDGATGEVVSSIGVGDTPRSICLNHKTNKIYVCCYDEGTVWVLEDLTGGIDVAPRQPSPLNFTVSPNPMSGSTEFVLNLPDNAGEVEFSIYNINGILLKSFSLGRVNSSQIDVAWNGTGNNGEKCASGTYIGVLKAGEDKLFKGKFIIVK